MIAPSQSHPPLTWPICVALAATMTKSGHFEMGVATLLAFDCYLRISEHLQLLVGDVALANDPRLGGALNQTLGAIRFAKAKTGKNQWVTIRNTEILQLLSVLMQGKAIKDKVFGFTESAYRYIWKKSLSALGLAHIGYVPHSTRHGGATADDLAGISLENIVMRGRWKSTESARIYIQSGRALLLTIQSPAAVHELGTQLSMKLFANFMQLRLILL